MTSMVFLPAKHVITLLCMCLTVLGQNPPPPRPSRGIYLRDICLKDIYHLDTYPQSDPITCFIYIPGTYLTLPDKYLLGRYGEHKHLIPMFMIHLTWTEKKVSYNTSHLFEGRGIVVYSIITLRILKRYLIIAIGKYKRNTKKDT